MERNSNRAPVSSRGREPDLIGMLPAGHDAAEALYRITDATPRAPQPGSDQQYPSPGMHRPALADGGRQIVPSALDPAAGTDGQQARRSAGRRAVI
jgi:hypothetical protein